MADHANINNTPAKSRHDSPVIALNLPAFNSHQAPRPHLHDGHEWKRPEDKNGHRYQVGADRESENREGESVCFHIG